MDRFHIFEKRSFRFENDEEKTKRSFKNESFNIHIVFEKRSFSKMIVFLFRKKRPFVNDREHIYLLNIKVEWIYGWN